MYLLEWEDMADWEEDIVDWEDVPEDDTSYKWNRRWLDTPKANSFTTFYLQKTATQKQGGVLHNHTDHQTRQLEGLTFQVTTISNRAKKLSLPTTTRVFEESQ